MNRANILARIILTLGLMLITSACSGLFSANRAEISISLSNQSNFTICEVYISAEKANDWGKNKLGETETFQAGTEKTFSVKSGTYDLLVRSCDQEALYSKSGINHDFTDTIGGTGLLPIRLRNASNVEICFIYITSAGSGTPGQDQLGGVESILPGQSRVFFREPGVYNLQAEDCNKNVISSVDNFDPSSGSEWNVGS